MSTRREFVLGGMAAATGLVAPSAFAQATNWPEAPVRIIVPFTAGNAADVLTRMVAEQLQARFKQNFIIENRVGAGGMIAMDAVKNAKPDGNTIVSATIGTLSINQFLYKKMQHDPENDFAYATMHWQNTNVIVVAPDHPAKTLQELIAWAKTKPGGANMGSAPVGTSPHLASYLFKVRANVPGTVVPFAGGAQSLTALMAGNTDMAIDNVSSSLALIKGGKVRALAVTADERWPTLPDVPTTAEAGLRNFVLTSWGALVMPKGTPPAVVNKLSEAVQAIAADPAMQQRFMDRGARIVATTPAQTHAFAAAERVKWKEAVEVSGAKLD